MREKIMNQLVLMLNNNVGNKLTYELGTGIATSINQLIMHLEQKPDEDDESAGGGEG